ncbi:MAG: hypothetical protein K2N64_04280 [Anaeroplasmataceae bacterium]|nr:hypothetical protein [Anaeroplasmataceae bacterium]
MTSRDIINEYESRIRAMEKELEEKRLRNLCRSENEDLQRKLEETERIRRQEMEALRLRVLQEEVERKHQMMLAEHQRSKEVYYHSSMEQDVFQRTEDTLQLRYLQEQIRQQELENERLKLQLQMPFPSLYSSTPTFHQPTGYSSPNIYVTQNSGMPNQASMPLPPLEEEVDCKCEDLIPEEKDLAPRTFMEQMIQHPFEVNDGFKDIIKPRRLTFAESYEILNKTQKKYCDSLRAYAILKSGAKESLAKYHLSIGSASKHIIKFMIKNGTVITLFRLEDERLRRLRKSANSDGAEIKVKETELAIVDDVSFQTATEMIDLRLVQLEEDKEYQKNRASNRRKTLKAPASTLQPLDKASMEKQIAKIAANLA